LAELLDWIHERVKFDKGNIARHNDPKEILAYGRGRCGEFSVLFTALCLAHDYRARLILDVSDHVWTEVWDGGQKRWVHVDPSEKRIDDPFMYERDWKKTLREIYAFEDGKVENVTRNYKMMKV
jgi:peptide-N4-(N-acetyl-beta-glucosaminyl)asparagine amidase